MREISSYEREAGRNWRTRQRLSPSLGYMLGPNAGRRAYANVVRVLPRISSFLSLEHAAACRRQGDIVGKRFARFALAHARDDEARWRAAGGRLP